MAVKNIFCAMFFFSQTLAACNDTSSSSEKEVILPPTGREEIVDTNGMAARAWYYYEMQNFEMAEAVLDTLVKVDSNNGEWYYKRAYCRALQLEYYSAAIADYKLAINRNYRRELSLYNIGVIYQVEENFDSAIYYYEQVLKEFPTNAEAKKNFYEIGKILNKVEK